jgi:hypothetical protein
MGAVRTTSITVPLKKSVSKGTGSREFGSIAWYLPLFSTSVLSVGIAGGGLLSFGRFCISPQNFKRLWQLGDLPYVFAVRGDVDILV